MRLLLTDEQATNACRTLDVHPTELDGAALRRAGIVDIDSNRIRVEHVEDVPGRLGIQAEDASGETITTWFDDETAQKRAALEALKRFERVRYVVEVASAFDWPKPTTAVLEWALGAAEEIHAMHTNFDRDKDRLAREIGSCRVNACIEACAVLGITRE